MYRLTKTDGTFLGLTESVLYIKIHENGCYTPALDSDADGVAYKNTVYNFPGRDKIPGAEAVVIAEIDAGELFEQCVTFTDLAAAYSEGVQEA